VNIESEPAFFCPWIKITQLGGGVQCCLCDYHEGDHVFEARGRVLAKQRRHADSSRLRASAWQPEDTFVAT
jgi:hypothetical protein